MRTFLGVFLVLIVSGDDNTVTVTGVLEDSVLLPCSCSERDVNEVFQWQMDEPNMMLVLKYVENNSNYNDRYRGRAEIFLPENSNNCSVLLINITAADMGKYRCSFHSQDQYKKFFVNLNLSASYNVCQKDPPNNVDGDFSEMVFQCDASGRFRDAEIQWTLDGQPLTNSSITHITHTINTLDGSSTGLYSFTSKLTTKLSRTSKPECDIKAKGISTITSNSCTTVTGPQGRTNPELKDCVRHRYLNTIPIMLVLGFSLVLWWRWKVLPR